MKTSTLTLFASVLLTEGGGGSVGPDPITGALLGFELAWNVTVVPAVGVAGWAQAKHSKKEWGPCIRGLKKEFAGHKLDAELQDALTLGLREKGQSLVCQSVTPSDPAAVPSGRSCPFILSGDIQRVQLIVGDTRKKISVEMAVRFRLRDERADDYLYDRTLKISSEFREIKGYSAKPGRARFGDDLSKAVQSGVKLFLAEASLASPTADKPEFANEQ